MASNLILPSVCMDNAVYLRFVVGYTAHQFPQGMKQICQEDRGKDQSNSPCG